MRISGLRRDVLPVYTSVYTTFRKHVIDDSNTGKVIPYRRSVSRGRECSPLMRGSSKPVFGTDHKQMTGMGLGRRKKGRPIMFIMDTCCHKPRGRSHQYRHVIGDKFTLSPLGSDGSIMLQCMIFIVIILVSNVLKIKNLSSYPRSVQRAEVHSTKQFLGKSEFRWTNQNSFHAGKPRVCWAAPRSLSIV
jgi:hypothetical protein